MPRSAPVRTASTGFSEHGHDQHARGGPGGQQRREAEGRDVEEDHGHEPDDEGEGQGAGAAAADRRGGEQRGQAQEDRGEHRGAPRRGSAKPARPSFPDCEKITRPAAPKPRACAATRASKRPRSLPSRIVRRETGWEKSSSAAPRSGARDRTPIRSAVRGTRSSTSWTREAAVRAKSWTPCPPDST